MKRDAKTAGLVAALAAGAAPVLFVLVSMLGDPAVGGQLGLGDVVVATGYCAMGSLLALFHVGLAAPLYLFLQQRGWVNWGTAALSGFLIGALPLPLLFVALGWSGGSWLRYMIDVMPLFGLCGLVGGLTFRAVLGRPEPIE